MDGPIENSVSAVPNPDLSDTSNNPNHTNNVSFAQAQTLSLTDVFHALFTVPFTGTASEAVHLLSGKATHIASKSASPEECHLYLKATALHANHLLNVLLGVNTGEAAMTSQGNEMEQRLVSDVVQVRPLIFSTS